MSMTPTAIGPVIHSPYLASSECIPSQSKTMMGMKVRQQRTKYVVRLMEAT